MANIRLIKRRIKSAKNIAQITRAMQLVAASKMKKAQDRALSGRRYAEKIAEMVTRLAGGSDAAHHPLLRSPMPTGKRLVIVISTNKGLCGGLNTNLFRFFIKQYAMPQNHEYVTIGTKGGVFVERMHGKVLADFSGVLPTTDAVPSLTQLVLAKYQAGTFEGVDVVYSHFSSALLQEPKVRSIVPLMVEPVGDTTKTTGDYLIEPSVPFVFERLLPHYVENQIRTAVLEAEASEHSARMVAMKNATDNALSLVDDLTLIYNKARQEKITYEISDMVTARLAVEG